MPQRRYSDTEISNFLATLPKRETTGETESVYIRQRSNEFMLAHQYQLPADLAYFRMKLSDHGTGPKPMPKALTKALDTSFDDHVKGDMAGVGWHIETTHANGNPDYSYDTVVTLSGKSFYAHNVKIKGTKKTGNKGRSTFFTGTVTLAQVREDALYVAHCGTPLPANKALIIGRGRKTGVMIECLMTGDTITSAYPYFDFKTLDGG